MRISHAAVFEPKKAERAAILKALQKSGLKVTEAQDANALEREGVVVIGPSVKSGLKHARAIRALHPEALVLAAMRKPKKTAWADGVLPLPISSLDLTVRLPELARLHALENARVVPEPEVEPVTMRPGEGILDPLTGFYTFAHFKEVLFIEVKRARRYNFPLSLAVIAFDPTGAELTSELRTRLASGLALAIRRSLRDTDFPVQYSMDHVALLMPHTELQGALVVGRRICERVSGVTLQHRNVTLNPTVSVGICAAPAPSKEFSFAELVKHAQDAQQVARDAGGNRVEFSIPDPAEVDAREEVHQVV